MTNTTQREQRKTKFMPFSFEIGTHNNDVFEYRPAGRSFTLKMFPRLLSGFDPLTLEVKTKNTAPEGFPYTAGGCQKIEYQDQIFTAYCIGFGSGVLTVDEHLPHNESTMLVALVDSSGKIIKTTITPRGAFIDWGEQAAFYTLCKMGFDRNARQLESRNLPTKIEPIDEVTLSHHFTAKAILPGGEVVIRRPVSQIRDAGKKPEGFNFWDFGYSWTAGNRVAFVGKDVFGGFHGQVFENNARIYDTEGRDFAQVIMATSQNLNA